MDLSCQIEHVDSDSDVGTTCGKPDVAKCADARSGGSGNVVLTDWLPFRPSDTRV